MIILKPFNFVFCEGFRAEIGGKLVLFGVSAPQLSVLSLPAPIVAAFWVDTEPSGIGRFECEFRCRAEDEEILIAGKMGGENINDGRVGLPLGPFPLNIKSAGKITCEWKFGTDPWVTIGELIVSVNPNLSPIA